MYKFFASVGVLKMLLATAYSIWPACCPDAPPQTVERLYLGAIAWFAFALVARD